MKLGRYTQIASSLDWLEMVVLSILSHDLLLLMH